MTSIERRVGELEAKVRWLESRTERPLTGSFLDTATSPSDDLRVTVDGYDGGEHHFGPVRWSPMGGALPQAGDEAVIIERDDGVWQVVAWWSSAQSPAVTSYRPQRFAIMVANNAWSGDDPTALGKLLTGAITHNAAAGADETARLAFEAARPGNLTFPYLNFGLSHDDPTSTTRMLTTAVIAGGFQAKYNGVAAGTTAGETSINMGKTGWGLAWAQLAVSKLKALATPAADGMFGDDVNVADTRLPSNNVGSDPGVPDGYASPTAYAAAIKVQLTAARDHLAANGYKLVANVSGISEWALTRYGPADSLVEVADYSLSEFGGMYANGTATDPIGWPRLITAGATGRLLVQTFGNTRARALFNDYWARIIGARAAVLSPDNTYAGPPLWFDFYANDYGEPVTAAQLSSSHAWRTFSGGWTLHVNLSTFGTAISNSTQDPTTITP